MQKSLCVVTLLCAATSACPDVNLGSNTRQDGGGDGGFLGTGGSAVIPGTGGSGTGGAIVSPGTGGVTTVVDAAPVTGGQVGTGGAAGSGGQTTVAPGTGGSG